MRALLLSMVFFPWAACGPRAATDSTLGFDEELGPPRRADAAPPRAIVERPIAQPGKGLRRGTIERERLVAVLNAGAGTFLRQLELNPKLNGERFVGWQLVQLVDKFGPLVDVDLLPGDVLLAINGKPISRPDQLQSVWDSLRTANAVTAQVWRGDAQLTLEFAIEPKI